MASDSAPFAEGNYDPLEALEAADKFSTADALDIEADESEPPEEIWGGLRLAPGQLMEVIGGSGLGKSRMMLNLAVNQVLGRDFAGLPPAAVRSNGSSTATRTASTATATTSARC